MQSADREEMRRVVEQLRAYATRKRALAADALNERDHAYADGLFQEAAEADREADRLDMKLTKDREAGDDGK